MNKIFYVYILASKPNGTLYIGITNNLLRRVYEHKKGITKGFTKKYSINKLVYYEDSIDVRLAIQREKQLKWWKRSWKLKLIEDFNPDWKDLYYQIGGKDDLFDGYYDELRIPGFRLPSLSENCHSALDAESRK